MTALETNQPLKKTAKTKQKKPKDMKIEKPNSRILLKDDGKEMENEKKCLKKREEFVGRRKKEKHLRLREREIENRG